MMIVCSLFHLGLSILLFYNLLAVQRSNALRCTVIHASERTLYLVANLLLMIYYFHLYRHGRVQSMDIFIFDLQKRIAIYGLFLPLLVVGLHNLSNVYFCREEPFPLHTTVLYFCQLAVELLLLLVYFSWYQRELKRYSGEESQPEEIISRNQSSPEIGTTQPEDTLNN